MLFFEALQISVINILRRFGDEMVKYFKILLPSVNLKKKDGWIKINSLITSQTSLELKMASFI